MSKRKDAEKFIGKTILFGQNEFLTGVPFFVEGVDLVAKDKVIFRRNHDKEVLLAFKGYIVVNGGKHPPEHPYAGTQFVQVPPRPKKIAVL